MHLKQSAVHINLNSGQIDNSGIRVILGSAIQVSY